MKFKQLSIQNQMLIGFISLILFIMLAFIVFFQKNTGSMLTQTLSSSLEVMKRIAARSAVMGMEFEDQEAVRMALTPFTREKMISLLVVRDRTGKEIFQYRKVDLPVVDVDEIGVGYTREGELFDRIPIESDGNRLGELIIGISLAQRDYYLSKARAAMGLFVLLAIGVFTVAIIYLARHITVPIRKMTRVAEELSDGNFHQQLKIDREDEIGKLAGSFNKIIQSLREKTRVAQQISQGNLNVEVELASSRDELGKSMQQMKEHLSNVMNAIFDLLQAHRTGDYEMRIPGEQFSGVYREVTEGVNGLVSFYVESMGYILNTLDAYAKGDFSQEMERLPGKMAMVNERVDEIKRNLERLVNEILRITDAARAGKLSERCDEQQFEGAYRNIVEGLNKSLDVQMEPIEEAVKVLEQVSQGNLMVRMEGEYQGDHSRIKIAVNHTIEALNEILSRVAAAADQVTHGARQVAASGQAVSQGATEQASSLEEISSSMTELNSQTKLNAENAVKASQLASSARKSADEGNEKMQHMLQAMEEINESSTQISRIIKVIDEIAFQTNLLALNAAVEAARAGIHGKGFAVVAEEVRNLAQRSAKAAKETTELIEKSVERAGNGTEIAQQTATALQEIIHRITQVTDLVGEITSASKEQVQGIEQVNRALEQIDSVTQSNAANAEESASAAEELTALANQLKEMLNRFRLRYQNREVQRDRSNFFSSDSSFYSDSAEENGFGTSQSGGTNGKGSNPGFNKKNGNGNLIILDDDEFGDF